MLDNIDDFVDDLTKRCRRIPHTEIVKSLMDDLNYFHYSMENTYNMSFARRGEIGVWMNVARKYDRIDKLVKKLLSGENIGVVLVDTLIDLALYCLKWVAIISIIRPDDVREWYNTVYNKDTGVLFPNTLLNTCLSNIEFRENETITEE